MNSVDDLCVLIRQNLRESQGDSDIEIGPDTTMLISGLLDSLTIMKIVTEIERHAGVSFPETEIVAANFRTPASLWQVVRAIRSAPVSESAV